jgi:hypothetical protein
LHLVFQTEGKEFVDHLLQDFTILELPEPGVEAVSKLLPGVLALFGYLPFFKE